jgi:hypothetical protein
MKSSTRNTEEKKEIRYGTTKTHKNEPVWTVKTWMFPVFNLKLQTKYSEKDK